MIRPAGSPVSSPAFAVTANDETVRPQAERLARALDIPYAATIATTSAPYLLIQTPARLELYDQSTHERIGVSLRAADLAPQRLTARQPLARALGRGIRRVVDATAGLGADTVLLAARGCRVTAIERHPIVAALLRDGIDRAVACGLLAPGTIEVVTGDARQWLSGVGTDADAVFLDPMFPLKRKKSAAVRKELRLLRALVGDDADGADLLDAARAHCRRAIVKRPAHAAPLAPTPSACYTGKLVRYDVYRRPP